MKKYVILMKKRPPGHEKIRNFDEKRAPGHENIHNFNDHQQNDHQILILIEIEIEIEIDHPIDHLKMDPLGPMEARPTCFSWPISDLDDS